jgi:hypothetical protein
MNSRKRVKMIENYIKKHGVRRLAPDQRGEDLLSRESDLKLKKLRVKLLRERQRRFRLLNKD